MINFKLSIAKLKMKVGDFQRIEYLRSQARAMFHKHSLPRWSVFLFDGSAVAITFIFAYFLRYNFEFEAIDFGLAFNQSILAMGVYCGFSMIFRSFVGLIRHTTIRDIFKVIITTTASLITLLFLTFISRRAGWYELLNIPLSIILIHYISINAILFTVRILIKMFYELVSVNPTNKKNVIIFGAGVMGVIVKGVIMSDRSNEYNIVAFLDNNKKLQGKNLEGIPVFGPKKLKREFLEKFNIETMIFAIKDIPPSEKSEIYSFAVDLGLEVLEVPVVSKWFSEEFQLDQLKKIKLQDLLGRDPIQMNMQMIGKGLRNKTILVTGSAGSIGSEIVRQLMRFNVGKLILLDNGETPMFHLENELQEHFGHASVRTILADVTDQVKMDWIFREFQPEIVFHAAAYKHVSLMEENPHEAIRVNVGGTTLLTKLALKYRIQKFVMVSTDKAVNPTNVMGASKRMCEMILQSRSLSPGNRTQFVITRFGNVLGSNGSVVPIFRKQIEEGGPVTVTHREITRYFMTIPEACQLVLEAGFMGMGGEVFVFDMGKPVKIDDLARQMIRLSGFVPDKDIQIEYIGLRPGEKLYEELIAHKEKTMPTYNPKVKIAEVAWLDHKLLLAKIHTLLYSYPSLSEGELVSRVAAIVPEYQTSNEKYSGKSGSAESIEFEVYPD
ncbi:MAG: polysaccharide biosynthesis protein [Bacteroidales bacterium]|nr:polysaccharide biosynthesis protein [Bacteroidales bacterium]